MSEVTDAERYNALRYMGVLISEKQAHEIDAEFDSFLADTWEDLRDVTYQADTYAPDRVVRKMIGFRPTGQLMLYEIDAGNWTIRESVGFEAEWPARFVVQARQLTGLAFNQVEVWRHEHE